MLHNAISQRSNKKRIPSLKKDCLENDLEITRIKNQNDLGCIKIFLILNAMFPAVMTEPLSLISGVFNLRIQHSFTSM